MVLLETHPQALRSLQTTRERLQLSRVRVLRDEALSFMRRAADASFELVFLDPPFEQTALRQSALQAAVRLVVGQSTVASEEGVSAGVANVGALRPCRMVHEFLPVHSASTAAMAVS